MKRMYLILIAIGMMTAMGVQRTIQSLTMEV